MRGGFRTVVGVVPQPTTAPNFILSLNIEMGHLSVKWDTCSHWVKEQKSSRENYTSRISLGGVCGGVFSYLMFPFCLFPMTVEPQQM